MPETPFDDWIAERYEVLWPELFDPAVVDPTVDFLAQLASAGPALELGIGTGRIALPLSRRGVRVPGIELSPAMVAQLGRRDGAAAIDVTVDDFAITRPGATFRLVYLLRNTITNLTSQEQQIQTFHNVAASFSREAASSSRTTSRSFDGYHRGRPRTCSPRLPPMLAMRSTTLRRRSRSPTTTG
jgi:Methyltransferase domain